MNKGEKIAYYLYKECGAIDFIEWLEVRELSKADWDKFMEAGKSAFSDTQAEAEIIHEEKNLL